MGSSALTFEELSTVFVLNSRPLCLSGDSTLDPLTPAHFLTGAPYTALPKPSVFPSTAWNDGLNYKQWSKAFENVGIWSTSPLCTSAPNATVKR